MERQHLLHAYYESAIMVSLLVGALEMYFRRNYFICKGTELWLPSRHVERESGQISFQHSGPYFIRKRALWGLTRPLLFCLTLGAGEHLHEDFS